MSEHGETGWLIESRGGAYWTARNDCWTWGTHDDAVRFARKQDAESVRRYLAARGSDVAREAACTGHAWVPRGDEAHTEQPIDPTGSAAESGPVQKIRPGP